MSKVYVVVKKDYYLIDDYYPAYTSSIKNVFKDVYNAIKFINASINRITCDCVFMPYFVDDYFIKNCCYTRYKEYLYRVELYYRSSDKDYKYDPYEYVAYEIVEIELSP